MEGRRRRKGGGGEKKRRRMKENQKMEWKKNPEKKMPVYYLPNIKYTAYLLT